MNAFVFKKNERSSLYDIRPEILRRFLDLQYKTTRSALKMLLGVTAPGKKILDFGSGNAPYKELFQKHLYQTYDIQGPSDLEFFPQDSKFDPILCLDVLEHLASPSDVLCNLREVLAENGQVWGSVPWSTRIHPCPEDFQRWTPQGLQKLASQSGFCLVNLYARGNDFSTLVNKLSIFALESNIFLKVFLAPFVFALHLLAHAFSEVTVSDSRDPLGYFFVLEKK